MNHMTSVIRRALDLAGALGVGLLLIAMPAQAERFNMEGAIINSVDAKAIGTTRSEGEIDQFFTAQKRMVVDILDDLGVPFDTLPAGIRDSIARFHTQNFAAFQAFSNGLNALDQGKFAEAKAFFEKAVELDPNFKLAGEKQVAMPQTNIETGLQLQSALREAAKSASSSGKTRVEVDASRAVAALLSGQSVVVGTKSGTATSDTPTALDSGPDYTSNEPGSGSKYAPRMAVGVTYTLEADTTAPVQIATTNEWTADQVSITNNQLHSVGDSAEFLATRNTAGVATAGNHALADGSIVYWGTWSSTVSNSASVTVDGNTTKYPQLGDQFHYLYGEATRAMPTTGSAAFLPAGGHLQNVSGNIGVNFVTRQVSINDLGFTAGGLDFSQLNGASTYSSSIGSGFFKGNYSSGTCVGCQAFSPNASSFTGNFVGAGADGLMLSNIMQTGNPTGNGTVGGVHLFTK